MSARYLPGKCLRIVVLTLGFMALPTLAAPIAAGQDHAAHEHAGAPAMLTLDAGKKWATDTPLRQAMTSIRNAVSASLPAVHTGKFSADEYAALAGKINGEVNYMVRNCKLKPAADAQLHSIIARMLDGATAMQDQVSSGNRKHGAVLVIDALADYNAYFDHPGWKPIQH